MSMPKTFNSTPFIQINWDMFSSFIFFCFCTLYRNASLHLCFRDGDSSCFNEAIQSSSIPHVTTISFILTDVQMFRWAAFIGEKFNKKEQEKPPTPPQKLKNVLFLPHNHLIISVWYVFFLPVFSSSSSYGSDSPGREFWPNCGPFLKKVEPSCDQTWWFLFDFAIVPA